MKLAVFLAALFLAYCGAINITIEETSAMIQYVGTEWVKHDKVVSYHGDAHNHARSQQEGSKAIFTFSGTAIYYFASLWSFDVSTVLTLDDDDSQTLNLTDPNPADPEGSPSESDIRWRRSGLNNGQHTLTVERGSYVLMDAITYTTDDFDGVDHYNNNTSGLLQNTTVQESDQSITYSGDWNKSDPNYLYSGGFHAYSTDPTAVATFTFTGVAVYFHSAHWPFRVTTVLILDVEPNVILDLYDHSVPDIHDDPTVESVVVWSRTNLSDGQHTLKISTGSYALVDAITYTKNLSMSVTNSSAFPTATKTGPSSGIGNSRAVNVGAIAGAAVGGAVVSLLTVIGVVLLCRRRHANPDTTQWRKNLVSGWTGRTVQIDPSLVPQPFMSPLHETAEPVSCVSAPPSSGYARKGGHDTATDQPPPSYRA